MRKGVVELEITLDNNKTHLLRILLTEFSGNEIDLNSELDKVVKQGSTFISTLQETFNIEFTQQPPSISKENK